MSALHGALLLVAFCAVWTGVGYALRTLQDVLTAPKPQPQNSKGQFQGRAG